MKLNKIFFRNLVWCLLLAGIQTLFAQSDSFNLTWDPNTEDDINLYRVYRSTSPGATQEIASVQHPTVNYRDTNVERGVLYYYRLKAVDFSSNASDFSEEVSAAIPLITGLPNEIILPADTTINIALDSLVADPDDADNEISWTLEGANLLTVSVNNRIASISTPANWETQENIIFKAEDQIGFFDQVQVTFKSTTGTIASAPEFQTIPEQHVNEDGQTEITLSDYVNDSDSSPSQLNFAISDVDSISFDIDNNVLTVTPAANWNGSRTATLTVTDQDNQSDQTNITITVDPVNDSPVLTELPQQSLLQGAVTSVDLNFYVSDVDNDVSDLQWQFSDYSYLSLDFNDQSEILQITAPENWEGFQYITVRVQDPAGAFDSDTLTVRITSISIDPPVIAQIPNIHFDEDTETELTLNDYVSDSDDPVQNLFWNARVNEFVNVQINHTTNIASFTAQQDWYGNADIWLYVTDPDQNKDSLQVKVNVNPVNDRPKMNSIPSVNLSDDLTAQLNLGRYTTDIDDEREALSWNNKNSNNINVIISDSTATFNVQEQWFGLEEIEIYVSDASGAADTGYVTIYRQNQAVAPTITSIGQLNFMEDSQYTIQLSDHVSDPDNTDDQLEWTFNSEGNINISINNTTQEMLLTPNADWFGSEEIFLTVADPNNNVDFDTLRVIVNGINDAPQLKSIGNLDILQNTVQTIDLKDYIIEVDGLDDITEISLIGPNNGYIGSFLDEFYYQLTFFTPSGYFGRETFLLKITDSAGLEAATVISVEVLEKNLAGSVQVAYFGSQTNLNVAWNTHKETKDYIEYGMDNTYGIKTDKDEEFTIDHDKILANLQENQTYHFRIVSEDITGKIKYSADSVFTTGSAGEINVFPIPYQASQDFEGNGIVFANLPLSAKLNIYNLLGEPVYKNDELATVFRWQAENNAGKKVSSGLYVYVIKDQENKKISSGKIIVVR